MAATSQKKILIVRFSSIGDIVLTSAVIRCVRQQLEAEVHYLTKSSYRALLLDNPHVSKVYTIDQHLSEVIPELRRERYDFVIDLHHNLRTWRLRALLRRPSHSFPKLNFRKWLLTNFKIDRLPEVHIVDRYFRAAAPLGVTYDGEGLDHFVGAEDRVVPAEVARAAGGTLSPGADFAVFAIGAAHATKRLTGEQIRAIAAAWPHPLFLVGGPGDADVGEAAAAVDVWNTCGKLSLQQSADLVRQARVVLTHDTGMMHLAAAFRRPIVSVWGNTVPAFGMTPFLPTGMKAGRIIEQKGLNCRPCSKIGFSSCPKGHFRCMRDHKVDTILSALLAEW